MTFVEIRSLYARWSAGTYRSRVKSVRDHHQRHAAEMSLIDYLQAAADFPRNHAKPKVRSEGTITFTHRDGRFIIVEAASGLIISYGQNP